MYFFFIAASECTSMHFTTCLFLIVSAFAAVFFVLEVPVFRLKYTMQIHFLSQNKNYSNMLQQVGIGYFKLNFWDMQTQG